MRKTQYKYKALIEYFGETFPVEYKASKESYVDKLNAILGPFDWEKLHIRNIQQVGA